MFARDLLATLMILFLFAALLLSKYALIVGLCYLTVRLVRASIARAASC